MLWHWWSHHPWQCSRNVWMWHLGMCFSSNLGSAKGQSVGSRTTPLPFKIPAQHSPLQTGWDPLLHGLGRGKALEIKNLLM